MAIYDALPLASYPRFGTPKYSIPGAWIAGVKHDLAEADLLKKKKLNVIHVSRVEFGLLLDSNFIYISNNPVLKKNLTTKNIVEVESLDDADLILIDEDLWLTKQ